MKTLFSIIFSLFIAGAGIVLAMNVPQDDPLCLINGHDGYDYSGTPPVGSSPTSPPSGMTYLGQLNQPNGFRCEDNTLQRCHWVYKADTEEWIPCSGVLERIGTEG